KPDVVEVIKLDKRKLPKGNYKEVGVEKRQVFDIEFKTVVTAYQAQILENEQGKRYTASFPKKITQAAQYGESVKAHAVYLLFYEVLKVNGDSSVTIMWTLKRKKTQLDELSLCFI
ncbi:hypothetical protein JQC92_16390, partial [Shewanella sp. 202IG2-18]|nr:hypothetical protein [Parashewanella hymeniacidonis]